MSAFARSFATEALAKWSAKNPGNAVSLLLGLWALPGQRATSARPLRLAPRDGHLNFYVKGQALAKLHWRTDGPRLSVYKSFVEGRRWAGRGTPSIGQVFLDYDAMALADPATAALIAGWIEIAESYACAEKRFLEDLIAANAGIIDLKTSLAVVGVAGSKRPNRFDVAIAQSTGGGLATIAFWEARCANNSDLRANTAISTGPKVLSLVEKYVRWMEEGRRVAQVSEAYRNSATTLLDLVRLFGAGGAGEEACVSIWDDLAAAGKPAVVARPGIAIANYWPEGYPAQEAGDKMRQCAISFSRNGYPSALERAGIRLHEVGPEHNGPALPYLPVPNVQARSPFGAGTRHRAAFA